MWGSEAGSRGENEERDGTRLGQLTPLTAFSVRGESSALVVGVEVLVGKGEVIGACC